MARPKNKEEYRAELAEAFAHVLEEKGLSWRKEWTGHGGAAPHNGITKACYRGTNAFYLSLISMLKGYSDPRWMTMIQIMDNDSKYHPKEKWHLKKGSKATYVEYWYPFDVKEKKALTWEQYKDALTNGRDQKDFTLSTRYTAVFNAHDVEGIPEMQIEENSEFSTDDLIGRLYGRFFKMYMYTAIAPIPLSSVAGEPTQNIGKSFLKSYAAVCLEGAIIVLACIIFSVFASSPPVVNPDAAAASMVWSYIGELIFNMLILVGSVKMADRLVREMMGL